MLLKRKTNLVGHKVCIQEDYRLWDNLIHNAVPEKWLP